MPPAAPPSRRPDRSVSSAEPARSRHWCSRRAVLSLVGTAGVTAVGGCNTLGSDPESAPLHDGDWHSYGNSSTNINRVAGGTPEPTDQETITAGGWPYTPPVIHEDVVYFARDRSVVAITTDGSEQWSRRLDSEVSGAPAIDPDWNRLYVPTRVVPRTDGPDPAPAFVSVLSLADGTLSDRFRVGDRRTSGVTVVGGDLYARSATACVKLAPDGTEHWRHSLAPLIYDEYNLGDSTATQIPPAVTDDGVYVPDRDALVKLDRETGEKRWRVPVDTPYAASVVGDDTVVQTGWQETVAVTRDGKVTWRRDLQSRAGAAVADGTVYVAAGDLHELTVKTGETNWQAHLPTEGTAAPVVTDDSVLVSTGDVRAYSREDGHTEWQTSSVHATAFCSPVIAAGRTFVVGPAGLASIEAGDDS